MSIRLSLRCTSAVAITTVLATATAAHADGPVARKGFVELGLAYGYAMSNADFLEVDTGRVLDPPHASGPALDLAGGYALAPGFAIIGDLQHAWATTIRGVNDNGDEQEYSWGFWSLGLGLRGTVALGPGEFYSQMTLGAVLGFDTERDEWRANGDTRHTTIGYNNGLGGRGEAGYHYPINDRMYVGGGLRLQAFSTDNAGRERIRVDQDGNVDRTLYSTDPNAQNADRPEALSVQDLRLRLSFGLRF